MSDHRSYPRFTSASIPHDPPPTAERWFLFRKDELLVVDAEGEGIPGIPTGAVLVHFPDVRLHHHHLGELDGETFGCAELPASAEPPPGTSFTPLRPLFGRLDPDAFRLAGRAYHLLHWDDQNRYCGRCGAPTHRKDDERALVCRTCGNVVYPRISPAVIVLIRRGDQVLLAHNRNFKEGWYSCVAGFMEPGEEFEDAAEREIFEEVGVRVKSLRYFGSQPWPFPDSLMVGFVADHESGEIQVDGVEIDDARWFDREHLPDFPGGASIAGRMIRWWLDGN